MNALQEVEKAGPLGLIPYGGYRGGNLWVGLGTSMGKVLQAFSPPTPAVLSPGALSGPEPNKESQILICRKSGDFLIPVPLLKTWLIRVQEWRQWEADPSGAAE